MHSSIIHIVDKLLQNALIQGASDIHFEPEKEMLRVRFRVDGDLYDQMIFSLESMPQIVARLKVLAHIDIAEKRIPQDGKFSVTQGEQAIDFRVSAFPSMYGQKIVIRILNRSGTNLSLESLGFSAYLQQQLTMLIQRPHGVFLVTGPTGSGKTTTLYALLALLNTRARNIITLEDPVEYRLPGITQGNINPETGFTFQKGIRAMLRQDPDVLMVGEIRDKETAHIAIQAALTGHLVLSTLHTNDAVSAVVRLMDMGIEPYLINSAVIGVAAQRLVRLLCVSCKKKKSCDYISSEYADLAEGLYTAAGCEACLGRGYKGRTGIFELLVFSDDLRAYIKTVPDIEGLKKKACAQGMTLLGEDARAKVASGMIGLEELLYLDYIV